MVKCPQGHPVPGRRSPLGTQWVRRRASFLLFLTFCDDIGRPSYFFRAFSGQSSRNRVILSSYQQTMPAIVDLKYAWKLNEAHTLSHTRWAANHSDDSRCGRYVGLEAPGAYMAQATSRVQPSSFQVPAVQHYQVLPRHSNQNRPAICCRSISLFLSFSLSPSCRPD